MNGVYDPHTNQMQYPKSMQPTHARWEQVDDYAEAEAEANGKLPNGHPHEPREDEKKSIFTPVKPLYSRNYMIIDTMYESAPASNLGVPGPDGDDYDIGFNGLSSVPPEIKAELPPDCLAAFNKALEKELQWKNRWGSESTDARRKQPIIDKGLVIL
jgi:chromatin structure-remodeling complex protein RSC7